MTWLQKAVTLLSFTLLTALIVWHVRPIVVWELRIQGRLADAKYAHRMNVDTVSAFAAPPEDWPTLRVEGLTVTAPIPLAERGRCEECGEDCILKLEGGTLAVFDDYPPETYREVIDLFAPDEDDLSLLRRASQNWRSISGLVARVLTRSDLPETFRFHTDAGKGVATVDARTGMPSLIIYAYSLDEQPTRVVGITGLRPELSRQILGSISVQGGPQRSRVERPISYCE